jgi:hypothetical protein
VYPQLGCLFIIPPYLPHFRAFHSFLPGAIQTVSFELERKELSIWDASAQGWMIEEGDYIFYVTSSSRDLKSQATLTI